MLIVVRGGIWKYLDLVNELSADFFNLGQDADLQLQHRTTDYTWRTLTTAGGCVP